MEKPNIAKSSQAAQHRLADTSHSLKLKLSCITQHWDLYAPVPWHDGDVEDGDEDGDAEDSDDEDSNDEVFPSFVF